ncbi:MAG: M23 family metallopeptidase [Myxococcales bacterium]|jgi:murein DD-endopeptidase
MFQKKAGGLFDLAMASLAIATLCTATPLGELAVRAARRALGTRGAKTSLVSFFSAGELSSGQAATGAGPLATSAIAYGNTPALLKAFAIASARANRAGEVTMDLTAEGLALLRQRGARPADLATPERRLREVSRAIPELENELGSREAALAALVIGIDPLRYAVGRTRAEGRAPTLDALLPHLAPAARLRASSVVGQTLTLATAFELLWPVAPATKITSAFGTRTHPITGKTQLHSGIDLSVPLRTPIRAAGRARVKRVGEDGINGRYLVLDHGHGVTTAYCHNEELLVREGQVSAGEPIALSGNTGRSTGPHLHFQVEIDGRPVDPLAVIGRRDAAVTAVRK